MLLLLHTQNISSQNILSNVIKINEFSYPSIIFLSIVGTIVMRHLFLFQCYSILYWDNQIKLPISCLCLDLKIKKINKTKADFVSLPACPVDWSSVRV